MYGDDMGCTISPALFIEWYIFAICKWPGRLNQITLLLTTAHHARRRSGTRQPALLPDAERRFAAVKLASWPSNQAAIRLIIKGIIATAPAYSNFGRRLITYRHNFRGFAEKK